MRVDRERVDHKFFVLFGVTLDQPSGKRFKPASAVVAVIGFHIRRAVLEKPEYARNHILAALRGEEVFEVVVGKRRVLDVNLAYDAYFYPLFVAKSDRREVRRDRRKVTSHVAFARAPPPTELRGKLARPLFYQFVRFAFDYFVRRDAVAEQHKHIAVNYRRNARADHGQSYFESAVFFVPAKTYRDNGNVPHTHFFESFTQQKQVVRRPAPAARLKEDQRRFVRVEVAAGQRVQKLSERAYRGITHIVVQVFKTRVDYRLSLVPHDFQIVAAAYEYILDKSHVYRENIRTYYRVLLFHLLREVDHSSLSSSDKVFFKYIL